MVGRHLAALRAGDTDAVVGTFTADGVRPRARRSPCCTAAPDELRAYFDRVLQRGGGVGLQPCAVTDDGARCALEYNCVSWGRRTSWRPRPALGVYERGPDGLLAAARLYDDIEWRA